VLLTVLNSENLKLVGVDLCQPDLLTSVLEAVGVDFTQPTLILSEVVLTYLSPAQYDRFVDCIADVVKHCLILSI